MSRRGYTLVEMLVVVGIVSLVLGSVAAALRAMYRVDRQMRTEAAYGVVFPRLSLRFRSDAHAARTVEIKAGAQGGSRIVFAGQHGTTEYQAQENRIVRVVLQAEKRVHREVFQLPDADKIEWHKVAGQTTLVSLQVLRRAGQVKHGHDSLRADRIEAAVGIEARMGPDE